MICSTCDDYQLVPGTDGLLIRCPDCAVMCPVHQEPIAGRCPMCVLEVASGLAWMQRNPLPQMVFA